MRRGYVFILMIALTTLGLQQRAGIQFEKEGTPFKEILALAQKTGKLVMIDFYTEACGWCKVLEDSTFRDPEVIEFSQNFINMRVDAFKREGAELCKRFRVRGFPTVLFLDSTGEEIDRIMGFRPPKSFLERMKEIYNRVNVFESIRREYEADSTDVEIAFKWAFKLRDRGLTDEAKRVFERVLQLDPENKKGYAPIIHDCLADIARDHGDIKARRSHLRTIINKYPGYSQIHWVYLALAMSYRADKEFEEAIRILEQAPDSVVAKHPGQFRYNLAYLYMEKGDYEDALRKLEEISPGEFPGDAIDNLRMRIYLKRGDTEKALPLLRKQYQRAKGSARRLNNLAWTCVVYKVNIDEALKWAQEAVELSKWENGYIIDTLAELYALKGNYNKAIELEKKAVEKTVEEKRKREFQQKIEKWQALLEGEKRR